MIVTDATSAQGCGDGTYKLGGFEILVRGPRCTLMDETTLAGSVLTMNRAARNAQLFLEASLIEIAFMASLLPARLCGVENERGSIESGKRADLAIVGPLFELKHTVLEGRGSRFSFARIRGVLSFLVAESEGGSMIFLILAAILAQGQAQQLNQDKPRDDPQKKQPDVTVVIVPRTIPAGSEIRFVVRDGGVYLMLGASGAEIPVPGGGASGCLGDPIKASTISTTAPTPTEADKDKKEPEKEKKP